MITASVMKELIIILSSKSINSKNTRLKQNYVIPRKKVYYYNTIQIVGNKAQGRLSKQECAYLGVKKCSFFGKFDLLCFLETPILRFTLLWQRSLNINSKIQTLSTGLFDYGLADSTEVVLQNALSVVFFCYYAVVTFPVYEVYENIVKVFFC